jgi:hypothetical protein
MLNAYSPQNDLNYFYCDSDSTYQMDIGTVDLVNAQQWVMPNCTLVGSDVGKGIPIASAPYKQYFPEATHCKQYTYPDEIDYEFYQFSQNQITLCGEVDHPLTGDSVEVDTTDFLMATLNIDLNTKFTAVDSNTIDGKTFVYKEDIAVEGFGTLTTPDGNVDVLKIRNSYSQFIYDDKGQLTYQDVSPVITFVGKDGHRLDIELPDNSPTTGTVEVDWMEYLKIVYNPTAVSAENQSVNKFALEQNYPNPFNPSTTIKYQLAQNGQVSLKVFNTLGKEVAEILNGDQKAGSYSVKFDGSKLSSGIYYYQLHATDPGQDYTITKKLMLIK